MNKIEDISIFILILTIILTIIVGGIFGEAYASIFLISIIGTLYSIYLGGVILCYFMEK
jgi:hypothetical protein